MPPDGADTTAFRSVPQGRRWLAGLGIFGIALLFRLIHYRQSLWCDEMTSLLGYIAVPWHKLLAPGPLQYVPNDHPLFEILAKLCLMAGGGESHRLASGMVADLIRLPSLLAGAMLPVALAWPFRNRAPRLAILVGILAAVHPWLIAFSDEARGYSLMLLLGVVATILLPDGSKRFPILYGVVCSAILYTVLVGVFLLLAHGAFVLLRRRGARLAWMRGILLAGALSIAVYLPMAGGIRSYYQHPMHSGVNDATLADELPRFALDGEYFPTRPEALQGVQSSFGDVAGVVVPILLLIGGLCAGITLPELRPWLMVMALTIAAIFIAALLLPDLAEVRFSSWAALWMVFSLAGLIEIAWRRVGRFTGFALALIAGSWLLWRSFLLLPSQPIREAMKQADEMAPNGPAIVIAFDSAPESASIYGNEIVRRHPLLVAYDVNAFAGAESLAVFHTGRRPWVIIALENGPKEAYPAFWKQLQSQYRIAARLPGRVSPVTIYEPN